MYDACGGWHKGKLSSVNTQICSSKWLHHMSCVAAYNSIQKLLNPPPILLNRILTGSANPQNCGPQALQSPVIP